MFLCISHFNKKVNKIRYEVENQESLDIKKPVMKDDNLSVEFLSI